VNEINWSCRSKLTTNKRVVSENSIEVIGQSLNLRVRRVQ